MSETIHRIDRPYRAGEIIVYTAETGGAAYEWRITDAAGETVHDTRTAGYGSASLALRDALNADCKLEGVR